MCRWGRALKKGVLPFLVVVGPMADAKERENEGNPLWLHSLSQTLTHFRLLVCQPKCQTQP